MTKVITQSDYDRLILAVEAGRWYTLRGEYAFYKNMEVSLQGEFLQIYGIDFMSGEVVPVSGEHGYSWLELHEVAIHINGEHDGNFYYVGGANGVPVKPTVAETVEFMTYAQAAALPVGFDYQTRHDYYMSYSTVLAVALHFETLPAANLKPYV